MNDTKMCFFLEYKPSSLRRSPPIPILGQWTVDRTALTALKGLNFTVRTFGHLDCSAPPKIQALPLRYPSSSVCPADRQYVQHFVFLSFQVSFCLTFFLFCYPSLSVCPAAQRDRCHDIRHLTLTLPWRTPAQYKTNKGVKFGSIAIWVHILLSV